MIFIIIILLILSLIFSLLYYFLYVKKDIPFLGIRDSEWTIGLYDLIYKDSNFIFYERNDIINPVLTPKDTGFKDAQFIADPFIFRRNNDYYLFFEIMRSEKGIIGLATSSDSFTWHYDSVVLDEPFHLSYPSVFEYQSKFFMLPETAQKRQVRLYSSLDFPYKWKFDKILLEGKEWFDPSIIFIDGIWYLFVGVKSSQLELYYSNNLLDGWKKHPQSPIVENNYADARPAGKPIFVGDKLFRFAQDCTVRYGSAVRVFQITKIDPENYNEQEIPDNPILSASGSGWNAIGMHHLSVTPKDDQEFLAAVDGNMKLNRPVLFCFSGQIKISEFIYSIILKLKTLKSF